MSNHHDRGQLWIFIFNVMDNLEELKRTGELIDIIWDVSPDQTKTEKDWERTELLLKSYEKLRDESLDSALSNLKDLVDALSC